MVSQHSLEKKVISDQTIVVDPVDPDSEFGGSEERRKLERKLLWRIDCRMFILVVIYILNYVRSEDSMSRMVRLIFHIDRQKQRCVCGSILHAITALT